MDPESIERPEPGPRGGGERPVGPEPAGAMPPLVPPDPRAAYRAWSGPAPDPERSARAFRGGVLGHPPRTAALALLLFLLTIGSTWLTWGAAYAAAIMLILLSHEMGHYLMCRRYGVQCTPPMFLPVPVTPFGTLGAVILMRQRIRSRRVVFDIGVAGPLAGILPALAAAVWGIAHSRAVPVPAPGADVLQLGDSLFFLGLQTLLRPDLPAGFELMLHPVAYAGWAGLFVTALNLLPVGQLDGGHVLYGLIGRRFRLVSYVILAGLAVLAIWNPSWWLLVALLAFFGRRGHPPSDDEEVPLGARRTALGLLAMAIFVLSFTPRPISIP